MIGVWIIDIVPTHALCLSCPLLALLLLVLLVLLPPCERERSSSLVLARYRACGWSLSVSAGASHWPAAGVHRPHCRDARERRELDSTDTGTCMMVDAPSPPVDLDPMIALPEEFPNTHDNC